MTDVTLYSDVSWISPYVFSCFVTLREKQVDFKLREVDLDRGDQQGPEYRAISLTSRVPALVHDGFAVTESLAIVEYLEEAFPAPAHARVLPESLRDRARARQLLSWLRSDDTAPLRAERSTHTMFLAHDIAPLGPDAIRAAQKLFGIAARMLDAARGPHLFERFGVADADLAFALHRLILNGDAVPAALGRWAEATWRHPTIQAFLAHGGGKYRSRR